MSRNENEKNSIKCGFGFNDSGRFGLCTSGAFSTRLLNGVHLHALAVIALLAAFAVPASAQESGHSWSSSDDVPYPTQEASLRAYHQRVPGWEYANQIERVTITENAVQVVYWPGVEDSELQPL